MKLGRRAIVASLLVFGCCAVWPAIHSLGDDRKEGKDNDGKEAVMDVKFSCSQHGPDNMQLTLSLEPGTARKIEIIGGNSATRWFVKIDNVDVMVANKSTVKVRSGDTISWSVMQGTHGVVFAEKNLAEAMLTFDPNPKLVDQTQPGKLTSPEWKLFGNTLWGTDPQMAGPLATCTVK